MDFRLGSATIRVVWLLRVLRNSAIVKWFRLMTLTEIPQGCSSKFLTLGWV